MTHGHFDHGLVAADIKEYLNNVPKICVSEKDKPLYMSMGLQMMLLGIKGPVKITPPDESFQDGQLLNFLDGKVISTPGHTPGSVCFYFESLKLLITGDLIFKEAVGRTDLPGGSYEQLMESIKN